MIVSFSVENWMSFRDKASFSMIGSRERQHNERVPKVKKYNAKILPVSAIYGGNASGKTNFFKALNFVRYMVVRGSLPDSMIPVNPYILDNKFFKKPTRFSLKILIDDTIYEFSFALTRKEILEEKLVKITGTGERILYHRNHGKPKFDRSLNKYNKDNFLSAIYKGTRKNRLFLTNSISQNCDAFRNIYNWFSYDLQLIAPDARFEDFERFIDKKDPLYTDMSDMLPLLDTGIVRLGDEEIPFDNLTFPQDLKVELEEEVTEEKGAMIFSADERYLIKRRDDKLTAKKIFTYHQNSEGKEVRFDLRQESDGSKRVIDLLPAFLSLIKTKSKNVFVIDELDRSLHSLLLKQLINSYLQNCHKDSRSQLLFTTHNVLLMDQNLLRRDEMWVTERDSDGSSTLYSFSDFKDIRYDKDIRSSYLLGRMGGVPKLRLSSSCPGKR